MSEQDGRYTFTVFTPTYQRGSTLRRVKASLEAQTFQDFEWLIVDDGSTDGTRELVAGWLSTSPLAIRYVRQENAGKHVAFNRGVREARGGLFLGLDSDDECVPHALERLLHHWHSIPTATRERFCAVSALCVRPDGSIIGDPFPADTYDSDPLRLYFGSECRGDKWGFHRTDVLRSFPYPEPDGVRHVAPSVAWLAIGRHFRTRYVNEALLVVHEDAQGGRLHQLSDRSVGGRLVFHREVITSYHDFFVSAPLVVTRSGINYCRYSFHVGRGPLRQIRDVTPSTAKAIVAASLVLGVVAYVRDRLLRRRRTR